MLPDPRNYRIWPSVVRADVPTEMTILPAERAFLLPEGERFRLRVISFNGDELSYHEPMSHRFCEAEAHGGALRFTWTFPDEQQHLIILERDGKPLQEFNVYSLREDLYALRPLKGDLHSHSYRSDGKRDPAALAGHFREQGYEFFALTDHNRFYPGGEIDEAFEGVRTGIRRVRGEEVHTPGSMVHIIHVGGCESVTEQYFRDRAGYERGVADCLTRVPADIPEPYRERYAMAMWASERIHAAGGLCVFPHPFWRPSGSRVYNVQEGLARLFLKGGLFDAYELLGGMGLGENNRSVALWSELRAEGLRMPVVGSSDVHGLIGSASFAHLFTICFAKENGNDAVIEAVRAGRSVAVEMYGDEFRCYGSLRLVTYARFLLEQYYPRLTRLCQGEGVAMRLYLMGDADASLIEAQADGAEAFRRRFFGLDCAPLPDEGVRSFEEKWRAVHLDGPLTKGSSLVAPPVTRQI